MPCKKDGAVYNDSNYIEFVSSFRGVFGLQEAIQEWTVACGWPMSHGLVSKGDFSTPALGGCWQALPGRKHQWPCHSDMAERGQLSELFGPCLGPVWALFGTWQSDEYIVWDGKTISLWRDSILVTSMTILVIQWLYGCTDLVSPHSKRSSFRHHGARWAWWKKSPGTTGRNWQPTSSAMAILWLPPGDSPLTTDR